MRPETFLASGTSEVVLQDAVVCGSEVLCCDPCWEGVGWGLSGE